jgi:hypothetical protein
MAPAIAALPRAAALEVLSNGIPIHRPVLGDEGPEQIIFLGIELPARDLAVFPIDRRGVRLELGHQPLQLRSKVGIVHRKGATLTETVGERVV